MLQDRDLIPAEQLRHAAELLERAQRSSSEIEALALLGSVRDICQRVAGEIRSVLEPAGALVARAERERAEP